MNFRIMEEEGKNKIRGPLLTRTECLDGEREIEREAVLLYEARKELS